MRPPFSLRAAAHHRRPCLSPTMCRCKQWMFVVHALLFAACLGPSAAEFRRSTLSDAAQRRAARVNSFFTFRRVAAQTPFVYQDPLVSAPALSPILAESASAPSPSVALSYATSASPPAPLTAVGHHNPGVGHHPPGVGNRTTKHPAGVGHHSSQGHHPPGKGHHTQGTGRHPGKGHHPPGKGKHSEGVGSAPAPSPVIEMIITMGGGNTLLSAILTALSIAGFGDLAAQAGNGEFTLLLPSVGAIGALLQKYKLADLEPVILDIVKFHIVEFGAYTQADFMSASGVQQYQTLQGGSLYVQNVRNYTFFASASSNGRYIASLSYKPAVPAPAAGYVQLTNPDYFVSPNFLSLQAFDAVLLPPGDLSRRK
eukprot:TRINITY_DN1938_c0_g1_i3.p1 TRINITY_DN1938_c0_g1~~TRINITY_DN1938_c0_g1_i3.p1  ORF type:complete len:369 (-),score=23.94 TRINITY_DN1938_c0_g1_i3:1-1107(-)